MKLRLVIAGVMALLVAATAHATTLKLASDIDLLVLDGRKISGSLLKGAEGLELEQGEHQLLFRVEKSLNKDAQKSTSWSSSPLIVTFTTRARAITITLPPLTTVAQGKAFDKHPEFQLLNEHGAVIESQQDRLLTKPGTNYEQVMVIYNLKGNVASVPRFAQLHTSGTSSGSERQDFANGNLPGSRILQLWYQQVDSATRQRFVMLMRALRTS